MELDAAVANYRRLLDSEQARRDFIKNGVPPRFFGSEPEHVALRLQALGRVRENHVKEAGELLAKAQELTPPLPGKLNDKPFESIRDADDLFGPVLEVMARGAYFWVPLEQVESITMSAPRFPRDLLWIPARLEMKEEAGNAFLPALYPGSQDHADDQIKLGRATDWKGQEGEPVFGAGVHTFLVGDDGSSILDWRNLQLGQ
jgi:type VI secretion system protein ImpE